MDRADGELSDEAEQWHQGVDQGRFARDVEAGTDGIGDCCTNCTKGTFAATASAEGSDFTLDAPAEVRHLPLDGVAVGVKVPVDVRWVPRCSSFDGMGYVRPVPL